MASNQTLVEVIMPKITIVGLGPGSPDALTVGALRALRHASESGTPIWLRTRIHPTVTYLETEEGLSFTGSFDSFYDTSANFDDVYLAIVDSVTAIVKEHGEVVFAVPGHPLFGERTVSMLVDRQRKHGYEVEIVAAVSYVDSVLVAASREAGEFKVVDAAALPDSTNKFAVRRSPFDPAITNLLYQVYDRDIASDAKIALLDVYPADWPVTVIQADPVTANMQSVTVPLAELDWASQRFDHLTSVLAPPLEEALRKPDFVMLLDIMAHLRDPEHGCPWDREQTPQKLRRYLIEESHEVVEAIDSGDPDKYAEELGDLLLQVAFHSQLANEEDLFDCGDVIRHIVEKLIRRHPHVFGNLSVDGADEVLTNWEAIKRTEKGYEDRKSILDGVVPSLPALMQAMEISKRAAKAGFEWDCIEGVFDKLDEEVKELREARAQGVKERVADEVGDLLFTVVNLARFEGVDAEDSLRRMVARFIKRFKRIEEVAAERESGLAGLSQPEMEEIWRRAKREQQS